MMDKAFKFILERRLKYMYKKMGEFSNIVRGNEDFQTKSDKIDYIIECDIRYFGQNAGSSAKAMYKLR